MQQPPLLPEEILHRVLRVARLDGRSVLLVAGLFALAAAASGDYMGAIIGLLIAGAGAIELHGEGLLRQADLRGVNWLVTSQVYLMAVIIGYCAMRLMHPVITPIPDSLRPMLEMSAQQLQMTTDEYIHLVYRLTFRLFAVITFFYQGGMALYYSRRREPIARALENFE
jgi:hypothetical protein